MKKGAKKLISVYLQLMNDMVKTRIRKFWQGKLSDDDRQELLSELVSREQQLKDDMENEFGKITDDEQLHLTEDYQTYLRVIHDKAGIVNQSKRVMPMWHKWMAAASILMVGALVSWLWIYPVGEEHLTANQPIPKTIQDTLFIRNRMAVPKMYSLVDGSRVTLYPESELAYLADYGVKDRSLILTGEAKFEVARDATKPFVVMANGYSTSALGTSFIVDARNRDKLNVKLLTGKVVVKATHESAFPMKDQYLVPGEELAIDIGQSMLEILSLEKQTQKPKAIINPTPIEKERSKIDLEFEEAPLSEVFEKIARVKQVRLDRSAVDVSELYFTGTFSGNDDVDQMLKIICAMNGLLYENTETGVIVITAQPEL